MGMKFGDQLKSFTDKVSKTVGPHLNKLCKTVEKKASEIDYDKVMHQAKDMAGKATDMAKSAASSVSDSIAKKKEETQAEKTEVQATEASENTPTTDDSTSNAPETTETPASDDHKEQ